MIEKLFHISNNESLLSNISFDPAFSRIRNHKKKEPNESAKKAYKAIEQSIVVNNNGNFSCVNSDK